MKRYLITVLAIVSLVAVVAVACAPAPEVVEKERAIKVGFNATTTGPIAESSAPISWGTLAYLRYVNEKLGGVEYKDPVTGETNKVKLDVIWEDNSLNVGRTIFVYKRQKAAEVDVMITIWTGPEAIASMVVRDRIPVLNIGAAAPSFMELEPRYFTVYYGSVPEVNGVYFKFIKDTWTEARPPKVGFMAMDVPAQRVAEDPRWVPQYAKELGIELLPFEWLPGAMIDSSVELTRVAKQEPDWVIVNHAAAAVATVLKDAERLGISEKLKIITYSGGFHEGLIRVGGQLAEGVYGQVQTALPGSDVPGIKLAREVVGEYRNEELTLSHLYGWVGAMGTVEGLRLALEEVGYENLTSDVINDSIHRISDFDTGGITQLLTVDPDYPLLNPWVKFAVIEGGKFKMVSDWYKFPSLH